MEKRGTTGEVIVLSPAGSGRPVRPPHHCDDTRHGPREVGSALAEPPRPRSRTSPPGGRKWIAPHQGRMGVTSLSSMRHPTPAVGIADLTQRIRLILDPAGPPIPSSGANASQS